LAHPTGGAGAPRVSSRVCNEVAVALKSQSEGRGDDSMPDHRQMVQRVVKSQREAHDERPGADFNMIQTLRQVGNGEELKERRGSHCRTIQFDRSDIALAAGIAALMPDALAA